MAVGTATSVEEYLSTTYHPDCDYVDGEVQERNVGEWNHARLQSMILKWLLDREERFRCRAAVEARLQVRPDRFRIPDIMLIRADAADEQIVRTPPLLCIEILSRGDTLNQIWDRIDEYFAMGVPVCWIIDPRKGRAVRAKPGTWAEVTDGILRAGEIEMPLAEVLGK